MMLLLILLIILLLLVEQFSKFYKIASTASLHILNDRSLICKNMGGIHVREPEPHMIMSVLWQH